MSLSINYLTGDATTPTGVGPKIIVHVCNDVGAWGKGFVMALSKRWLEPERSYRRWHQQRGDLPFGLGQVQFVTVDHDLWVANLIGQRDIHHVGGKPPIRYEAVKSGLSKVAQFAVGRAASIHMPRIGCGLAGGLWSEIEPIILQTLLAVGLEITVYDLG